MSGVGRESMKMKTQPLNGKNTHGPAPAAPKRQGVEAPTTTTALPTMTVVVPSYNQSPYIELTLRSILEQDYPKDRLEVLVLDGGSTDGTADILKRFDDQLAFWCSEPDGGQAAAINRGMAMATGDVVAWLNSDDIYLPGTLKKVAEAMQVPGVDAVSGSALHWDTRKRTLHRVDTIPPSAGLLRMVGSLIPQPSCFWKRSLWERLGGLKEDLTLLLDYELQMRLFAEGARYAHTKDYLSVILWHGENKCATIDDTDEYQRIRPIHRLPAPNFRKYVSPIVRVGYHLRHRSIHPIKTAFVHRLRHGGRGSLLGPVVPRNGEVDIIGAMLRQRLEELPKP